MCLQTQSNSRLAALGKKKEIPGSSISQGCMVPAPLGLVRQAWQQARAQLLQPWQPALLPLGPRQGLLPEAPLQVS